MQRENTKLAYSVVWVLVLGAAAYAANVTSASAWAVLAIFALLPPVVMLRLWRDPPQTVSESIHKAIR